MRARELSTNEFCGLRWPTGERVGQRPRDARYAGKHAYRRCRRSSLRKAGEVQRRSELGLSGGRKLRCALPTADSYAQQGVDRGLTPYVPCPARVGTPTEPRLESLERRRAAPSARRRRAGPAPQGPKPRPECRNHAEGALRHKTLAPLLSRESATALPPRLAAPAARKEQPADRRRPRRRSVESQQAWRSAGTTMPGARPRASARGERRVLPRAREVARPIGSPLVEWTRTRAAGASARNATGRD
jgi:hypothetical protein